MTATRFRLRLAAALFFLTFSIFGAEDSPRIRAFRVEGLRRTKPAVLEPYYLPYQGRPLSQFSRDALVQNLRSLGIFHLVEVAPVPVAEEVVDIRISVQEKWTLIPVPVGGATGGGRVYGGFMFMESNLLGYNKKMYGGAILSNIGWKGLLGYIDPKFPDPRTSLLLFFSGGVDRIDNADPDGTVFQKYETTGVALRAEIQRRVAGGFSVAAGAEFQEQDLNAGYGPSLAPPGEARAWGPTLTLRYQDLYYDRILVYGLSAQVRYEYKFEFDEYSGMGQFYGRISDRLRFGLKTSLTLAPDTPRTMELRVSERLFRTLPDGVTADSAAAAEVSLEFTAAEFRWGALTLRAAYEGGLFDRDGSDPGGTHGPAAGARVYMSRIALPAFGFDMSYGAVTGDFYFGVHVGLQM